LWGISHLDASCQCSRLHIHPSGACTCYLRNAANTCKLGFRWSGYNSDYLGLESKKTRNMRGSEDERHDERDWMLLVTHDKKGGRRACSLEDKLSLRIATLQRSGSWSREQNIVNRHLSSLAYKSSIRRQRAGLVIPLACTTPFRNLISAVFSSLTQATHAFTHKQTPASLSPTSTSRSITYTTHQFSDSLQHHTAHNLNIFCNIQERSAGTDFLPSQPQRDNR
jgi:hypothetical protein